MTEDLRIFQNCRYSKNEDNFNFCTEAILSFFRYLDTYTKSLHVLRLISHVCFTATASISGQASAINDNGKLYVEKAAPEYSFTDLLSRIYMYTL